MKCSHKTLIVISGFVWLLVGVFLLQLGLGLLLSDFQVSSIAHNQETWVKMLGPYVGSLEIAALILVAIALYIGYFKGRFVLGKSAKRGVARIATLSNPAPITHIYGAKYYILLGGMIALGMSIKYIGLNNDIRGFIDIIIGSALINGAMIYFKEAKMKKA